MLILMLMTVSQYFLLQKKKAVELQEAPPPTRYRYRAPIPYSRINRFTFVGMHDVLCYHLTRFTPDEIEQLLPLLRLHEIRF